MKRIPATIFYFVLFLIHWVLDQNYKEYYTLHHVFGNFSISVNFLMMLLAVAIVVIELVRAGKYRNSTADTAFSYIVLIIMVISYIYLDFFRDPQWILYIMLTLGDCIFGNVIADEIASTGIAAKQKEGKKFKSYWPYTMLLPVIYAFFYFPPMLLGIGTDPTLYYTPLIRVWEGHYMPWAFVAYVLIIGVSAAEIARSSMHGTGEESEKARRQDIAKSFGAMVVFWVAFATIPFLQNMVWLLACITTSVDAIIGNLIIKLIQRGQTSALEHSKSKNGWNEY